MPDVAPNLSPHTLEAIQAHYLIPCLVLTIDEQIVDTYQDSDIFACLPIISINIPSLKQWFRQAKRYTEHQMQIQELTQTQTDTDHLISRILMTLPDAVNVFDVTTQTNVYGNYRINEVSVSSHQLLSPLQIRLKNKAGEWRWIQSDYSVFRRDEMGEVIEILGIARDVSSSMEQATTPQIPMNGETKLNEAKRHFIRTASHEFRTPLTIIQGLVESLQRYHDRLSEDNRMHKFEQVYVQVGHIVGMIEDLLSIVRLENPYSDFTRSDVRLMSYCQQLITDFELAFGLTNCVRLDAEGCDKRIKLEKILFRYILLNLLSNAYKYSPTDSPIDVHIHLSSTTLTLTVQDIGIGIPSTDLDHIYDMFYRGKNINEVNGTGLGLYIVQQSIMKHGGHIDIQSTVNIGTTVTVTLPIA